MRTQRPRSGEPCEYCGGWRYRDGTHETIEAAERCHTDQLVVKLRRENATLQAEVKRLRSLLAQSYPQPLCPGARKAIYGED